MTPLFGPLAVVELRFEPRLSFGDVMVPLQAVALAAVIVVALLVFVHRVRAREGDVPAGDIAFVVLAAIPGAVVGGRLIHGLAYPGAYVLDPASLLDLGHGSLSLAGAVVGGAVTSGYLCRTLSGRVGVWADAAAVPLLLAIGGGKVAMLLGGMGQGLPWGGRGGVALLGDGPWGSTDPATPAYPTQLMEGAWALLGIPVMALLDRRLARAGRGGQGLALLGAVAWWLVGRAAISAWWRDEPLVGPWGPEGFVAAVIASGALGVLVLRTRRPGASPQGPHPRRASSV